MFVFIATVSSLYYIQNVHSAIDLILTDNILGVFRTRYQLATDRLDEPFILGLSARSGVEEEDTRRLVQLITKIRTSRQVNETELRNLVRGTELFNRKLNQ